MRRVGSWMQRGKLHGSASSHSLNSLEESQNLQTALRAAELILNDDIEGAEKSLESGNSTFHKIAKGVIAFLQAALGFEQDTMQEASAQLAEAESAASNDQYRAQRDDRAFQSEIYDKGSEFALCHAEAQIMGAVVGVLNESLTESIRGFYKLRKAYGTLNSLMEMENRYMKARGLNSLEGGRKSSMESMRSVPSAASVHDTTGSSQLGRQQEVPHAANQPSALRNATNVQDELDDDSDDSEKFYDADELHDKNSITKTYAGNLDTSVATSPTVDQLAKVSLDDKSSLDQSASARASPSIDNISRRNVHDLLDYNPDSDLFSGPIDIFVHSGANLCFGVLSLMISMIPPAFGKLLYIIGFRGDQERGLRMLWQASKFQNVNGGLAGLILLGWYNGLVGFCDIVPDSNPEVPDDVEGYPAQRLQALLGNMRKRYPQSRLWLIEESRMVSGDKRLDEALSMLEGSSKSQLKQLEALHMFEKSLVAMFAHRYQLCADSFIACVDLNNWSRALYYYISGAAHLTMYREYSSQPGREKDAAKQAKLAENDFKIAPTHIGKKKIMGRQLPFDVFVSRKVAKWEQRARERGCDLVDAIGVSPLEEMIYFWNGYKKMDHAQLERSHQNLNWSELRPTWAKEDVDEKGILALLRSAILRNQRKHDKAKSVLKTEILCHDPSTFKGQNKDDWPAPIAHYEMAVNLWMERKAYKERRGPDMDKLGIVEENSIQPGPLDDAQLVAQCKQWIEKAKNWEKYELDARVGMKVTAAVDAIQKWEAKHPDLAGQK